MKTGKELFNELTESKCVRLNTHNGVFHADDVFSTALLLYISCGKYDHPEYLNAGYYITVACTSDEKKSDPKVVCIQRGVNNIDAHVVYDTGLGYFDHHQDRDDAYHRDCRPMAAFGLLWREFGEFILPKRHASIEEEYVMPVDAQDNGIERNPLSQMIKNFNPSYDEDRTSDECFIDALDVAYKMLSRAIEREKSIEAADDVIKEKIASLENEKVLVLDKYIPYTNPAINSAVELVVFPDSRGNYAVCTVPESSELYKRKIDLPEEWVTTGPYPDGMVFCHKALFMATFKTMQQAIDAANSLTR